MVDDTDSHRSSDPAARRRRLSVCPNPEPRQDFVVTRTGTVTGAVARTAAQVRLRYVPDRCLVRESGWQGYLHGLSDTAFDTLEALAAAILADAANQLVPRWLDVRVSAGAALGDAGTATHEVVMEDRQPTWQNPALAARLGTG